MYGVLRSVAMAAGAVSALLAPSMAPAGSGAVAAVAPHPVRAADDVPGGQDGTLITRLRTPSTGTSIASPARDTLFACKGGTLTRPDRPWIDAHGVIDVLKRPFVSGTMHWHKDLRVTTTATTRRFQGNGLPGHPTGRFPVQKGTPAYPYYAQIPAHGYPSAAEIPIKPWDLDVTVPRDPSPQAQPTCIDQLTTGMALAGGTFHLEVATDAEDRPVDPNAALPLDRCWGHPYDTQYHYHGPSQTCFDSKLSHGSANPRSPHSPLVGYAIDGFGVFGPRGEDGKIVTNRDLDVCHGHTHAIMWDGKRVVMYHYHLNGEYPYSIGCFRGTPVTVPGSGHGWH
ncbi:YHYH protein [Streptomyces lydicus]|uniref:YHYH protein n=1 Tax=Streptomyces lydicus TaxID=47763 RepID=UPI0010127BB8|nr:YHYH protein [Streptomyces lydicus]MCZ1008046.1 YHYH protein [Streptomyces lydicus]